MKCSVCEGTGVRDTALSQQAYCGHCFGSGQEPTDLLRVEIARLEGRVKELEAVAEAAWTFLSAVRLVYHLRPYTGETELEAALRAAGYLKEVNNAG